MQKSSIYDREPETQKLLFFTKKRNVGIIPNLPKPLSVPENDKTITGGQQFTPSLLRKPFVFRMFAETIEFLPSIMLQRLNAMHRWTASQLSNAECRLPAAKFSCDLFF